MVKSLYQKGFSAVELLITLFVAAAFLTAGYQLFSVIIKNGGDVRDESRASNIVYEYLRRYSDSTVSPCVASTPLNNQAISISGLAKPKISVIISCPEVNGMPTLSKVEAVLTYSTNADTNTIRYVTYVDNSNQSLPLTDLTDGLIDWWKLNGNGTVSIGSSNLTNNGAPTATGQNGNPTGAFSFTASQSQTLSTASNYSEKIKGRTSFTLTGWVYPTNAPPGHSGFFGMRNDSVGGIYLLQLAGTNSLECRMKVNDTTFYQPSNLSFTPNAWHLFSMVYNGSTLKCYVDNNVSTTVSANWSTFTNTTLPFTVGSVAGMFLTGRVDDVRIYNKALSASEIAQLVAWGAK